MCFTRIESVQLIDFDKHWKFCKSERPNIQNLLLMKDLMGKFKVSPLEGSADIELPVKKEKSKKRAMNNLK